MAHFAPSVAPLVQTRDTRISSSAQRTLSVPVTTRNAGDGPGSPFGRQVLLDRADLRGLAVLLRRAGRRALRPLCTSFALRTLRTDRSLRARRAGFATLTGDALRTNGTLRPLCALRSARTNGTCWAGWTRRASWALRPRRRLAASADYQDRKKGGNAQGKSHG